MLCKMFQNQKNSFIGVDRKKTDQKALIILPPSLVTEILCEVDKAKKQHH